MSVATKFINYEFATADITFTDSTTESTFLTNCRLAMRDKVTTITSFENKIGALKEYSNITPEVITSNTTTIPNNTWYYKRSSSASFTETTTVDGLSQVQDTEVGCLRIQSTNGIDFTDDTSNLIGKALDIPEYGDATGATINLFKYGSWIFAICPVKWYSDTTIKTYYYCLCCTCYYKDGTITLVKNDWDLNNKITHPLKTQSLTFAQFITGSNIYFGLQMVNLNMTSETVPNFIRQFRIRTYGGQPINVETKSLDDVIGTSEEPDDGLTGYDLDKVRDGESDSIPIPDVSYINSVSVLGSLLKVYSITNSSLSTLAGELWSQTLIDQLYKTMTNPMSCIVNLRLQAISSSLAVTSENLHIGNYVSAASGNRIDTNAYQLDLGSLKCYMFFDNYIDYAPYTKVSLYLPFVGVVPLDTNEVMNSTLSVKYNVDMYSGSAVAYVHATRTQNGTTNNNLIGCYRCNLAFNIPLTSEINNSLLSTFATFTNPSSYVNSVGTISNMATTQILNSPTVQKSSGLSSNVGYMGVMYPYLIVERPIDYSDSKCLQYQGYDTLKVTTLTSGFNKYKTGTIKVTDDTLNSEEIEELKALLESGVVI